MGFDMLSPRSSRAWRGLVAVLAALAAALLAPAAAGADSLSSIKSNFNATSITSSRFIWFNAHITGLTGSGDRTVSFTGQTVTLVKNGVLLASVDIPDGVITFDSTATAASTAFTGGAWITTVPATQTGNVFVSGLLFPVSDISPYVDPAASNPVTWSGAYGMPSGTSLKWQWGAAVYTAGAEPNDLGVQPVEGGGLHAGTPVNLRPFVVGGARGGGGANYTGGWSGTGSVLAG